MPPVSERQRKAAGRALAVKRGEASPGRGASAQMAKSMSEEQLRDFARKPHAKRKGK